MASLAADIVESDAAFRCQFDIHSAAHHGGIPTPVPLGGQKVPQGMEADANWRDMPVVPAEAPAEDYGPEYRRLGELREFYGDLKKALNAVPVAVDAIAKHAQKLTKASAEAAAETKAALEKDEASRTKAVLEVEALLKGRSGLGDMLATIEDLMMQSAEAATFDKERCFEWGTAVKRVQQQCFAEMKRLLQEMKDAKKAVTAGPQAGATGAV